MQNSLQSDEKPKIPRVKERIKYFFKETFRPHSKEEYAEVFTRGLSGNSTEKISRKLPWLYIRVFAFNLILFAILAFAFRLASYSADYITAIVFGGLLFNIPLFIFFYELYPKRDFSLLKLLAVLVVGGVISTVVIVFGYQFIYSTKSESNVWISTLWVGFWEELIKGAVAIAAIALLKKKNPFLCFLIGFAVGTGYSFAEDLGYIYSLSRSYGTGWLVLTSVGRGLSCVCSHAPWTAMICWAFAKFKKPFINFRFYAVVIAMMALHYFADVPFFDDNLNVLKGVTVGWAIEAAVVIAIFIIVFFALKNSFKEIHKEGKPELPQAEILTEQAKLSHTANVTAVLCAVVLSVFAFAGCCIKVGDRKIYDKIYDEQEFIEFVQQGLPFSVNLKRNYKEDEENYSEFFSEGNLAGATQKEIDPETEYEYFYVYIFEEGTPVLQSVGVKVELQLYYLRQFIIYEDHYFTYLGYPANYQPVNDRFEEMIPDDDPDNNGDDEEEEEPPVEVPEYKKVSFFKIESANCAYSIEEGCFTIDNGKTERYGIEGIIAVSALAGATLIGGSAAFITLKIKARRKKNA